MTENEIKDSEAVMNSSPGHLDTGNENVHSSEEETEINGDEHLERITKMQEEVNGWQDKYLRLNAEFDNYKKRTLKERMEFAKVANSEIMETLLPVLDDFERALKAMGKSENKGITDGIVLIHNKMKTLLEQKGLQSMDSIGKAFDVELHEAITSIPVENESQKGNVMDEVERGYLLHGKVLRHAKVVVGA